MRFANTELPFNSLGKENEKNLVYVEIDEASDGFMCTDPTTDFDELLIQLGRY